VKIDVSVIIVSWNTCNLLCDCLRSIYEQTSEITFEVIVIDNASGDKSAQMVQKEYPQVILLENSNNRGLAAANNQGIAVAKGRYVLLLNSDTMICDRAIEKSVKYADSRARAAVVGCQVWKNQDVVQMTCFRFPSLMNLFLRFSGLARIFKYNRFFGREMMLWWRRDNERKVDVVSGMFMLVRRGAIETVGLMDEAYFMYYEETDWCYRFAQAGWERLFWPGTHIIHVNGGDHSTKQVALPMFIQLQKSQLIFFRKNHGVYSYWVARFLLALIFAQRVFLWTLILSYRRLLGKDVDQDRAQRLNFWLAFKFYLCGCEPVRTIH
jgi:GT2 family glycosyltransferase